MFFSGSWYICVQISLFMSSKTFIQPPAMAELPQPETIDASAILDSYLKGETDNPDAPEQNAIDESQIKVALFGGDKEVTDEMWDKVKRFVEFVAQKHAKG